LYRIEESRFRSFVTFLDDEDLLVEPALSSFEKKIQVLVGLMPIAKP
jgi:hypothetical protein